MDKYIGAFKNWFGQRNLREKVFTCFLSWALIYAMFSLLLFQPLDNRVILLDKQIKKTQDEIINWKRQLKYLRSIPNTQLYKEWVTNNKSYETLKKTYKNILGKPIADQWKEIIYNILQNHPNITIDEIKNLPESVYKTTSSPDQPEKIYQQQMRVAIFGDFSNIVNYLEILENGLPNIYWNSLNYEVTQYPLARVDMEFSVLYEKNRTP